MLHLLILTLPKVYIKKQLRLKYIIYQQQSCYSHTLCQCGSVHHYKAAITTEGEHQQLQMTTSYTAKLFISHILKIPQNIKKKNMYMKSWSTHTYHRKKRCKISPVHAMEAHTWTQGIAPFILNLGTRQRWMVNSTCSSFTPMKDPQYPINRRLGVAHRSGRPFWRWERSPSLTKIQTLDHPACSPATIPTKLSSSPSPSSANN